MNTRHSILIFGDQLSNTGSALQDADPASDVVLMIEARAKSGERAYHKRKLVLVLSAMRHFAAYLRDRGFTVDYHDLERHEESSFESVVHEHLETYSPQRLVVMEPNEFSLREALGGWEAQFGVPVDQREDTLFMASHQDFADFMHGRNTARMEFFYRAMRHQHGVLLDGDKPVGGAYNFDKENRASFAPDPARPIPTPPSYPPDEVTRTVLHVVERVYPTHFGSLAHFDLPVTRAQALDLLDRFLTHALPNFGTYEDAIAEDHWLLYHSLLSHVLNIGLLTAEEVVRAAEERYRDGAVPINSAEGFIRQILGWREYMRGIYWQSMPGFHDANYFGHTRPLPSLYWTGDTSMRCLSTAVKGVYERGYSHHIQRLMVLSNFANLVGVVPRQLNDWFWTTYIDAYDWVVTPNVIGMGLYADGGRTASKPYISGGNYINKMSDHCATCTFSVNQKTGPNACPFNYLYWNFLDRHRERLAGNPLMGRALHSLAARSPEDRAAIRDSAEAFLSTLDGAGVGNYADRAHEPNVVPS